MKEHRKPLALAAVEAERDTFREQARILGEQKAEWLCKHCRAIHPWRDGDMFTAKCPACGSLMTPTSVSVRALQEAREELARLRDPDMVTVPRADLELVLACFDPRTEHAETALRRLLDAVEPS